MNVTKGENVVLEQLKAEIAEKDDLIRRLQARLSWALASTAQNPAFQALLEMKRDQDPHYHINPLGIHGNDVAHLFKK